MRRFNGDALGDGVGFWINLRHRVSVDVGDPYRLAVGDNVFRRAIRRRIRIPNVEGSNDLIAGRVYARHVAGFFGPEPERARANGDPLGRHV